MNTLRIAFKEWAVICRALAEGKQALILRKGGIAEAGGAFRVEQTRFWLFPTFVHQQETGIVENARPLACAGTGGPSSRGGGPAKPFRRGTCVYHVEDLAKAWKLARPASVVAGYGRGTLQLPKAGSVRATGAHLLRGGLGRVAGEATLRGLQELGGSGRGADH